MDESHAGRVPDDPTVQLPAIPGEPAASPAADGAGAPHAAPHHAVPRTPTPHHAADPVDSHLDDSGLDDTGPGATGGDEAQVAEEHGDAGSAGPNLGSADPDGFELDGFGLDGSARGSDAVGPLSHFLRRGPEDSGPEDSGPEDNASEDDDPDDVEPEDDEPGDGGLDDELGGEYLLGEEVPAEQRAGGWLYRGRRRQRVGPVGWLRGLGAAPLTIAGAVLVLVLGTLGWWAGGGSAGTPAPIGGGVGSGVPGSHSSGVDATSAGTPPSGSASPTASGRSSSPRPASSQSPSPSGSPGSPSPTASPSASSPAPPPPPQLTRYEAEDATIGSGQFANDHRNYSGRGFVDYANQVGSYVEFRATVPAAGTVTLTLRYANGSRDNRQLRLTVNGADLGTIDCNTTWDWDIWTGRSVSVSLPAGTSSIRVTATTPNGGPNVDYLDVQT